MPPLRGSKYTQRNIKIVQFKRIVLLRCVIWLRHIDMSIVDLTSGVAVSPIHQPAQHADKISPTSASVFSLTILFCVTILITQSPQLPPI